MRVPLAGRPGRLVWSMPLLSAALVAISWLVMTLAPTLLPGVVDDAVRGAAFASAIALASTIVGALIIARQPGNLVGWLLCVFGLSISLTMPLTALAAIEPPVPGRDWVYWAASWLQTIPLAVIVLVSLYYPDGRLPSPRWRVAVWLLAVATGLLTVGGAFSEYTADVPIANPTVLEVFRHPLLYQGGLGWWLILLAGLLGAASLLVRFVRARGMQRQQLKWLLLAVAVFVAGSLIDSLTYHEDGSQWWILLLLPMAALAMPLAIGIAILRHRLYDIDLLINRTLIYGLLTATLGLTYAAVALGLGQVFGRTSSLAVAGATLTVAAAFQPVRRRIQAAVDRYFNRRRYDAARTIEAFSARLREQVDLDTLTVELLAVVEQTMQPTQVSLWLRPPQALSGAPGASAARRPM